MSSSKSVHHTCLLGLWVLFLGLGCEKPVGQSASGDETTAPRSESSEACDGGDACLAQGRERWNEGDRDAAFVLLKRACSLDEKGCEFYLRALAEDGRRDELFKEFTQRCEAGIAAFCGYAANEVTRTQPEKARELFEKGCEGADSMSCYNLGVALERKYIKGGDRETIIALYKKGCDGGFLDSCNNLAVLHATPGPQQDEARAAATFQKLCDGGRAVSCADFGDRLFIGRGVKKDRERGLKMLAKSCKSDLAYGCWLYGMRLHKMKPVRKKVAEEALRVAIKSCRLKDGRGCELVGDLAKEGASADTKLDALSYYREALALYKQACSKKRNGRLCGNAGLLYRRGKLGTPDKAAATRYMELGCSYDKRVCSW